MFESDCMFSPNLLSSCASLKRMLLVKLGVTALAQINLILLVHHELTVKFLGQVGSLMKSFLSVSNKDVE